MNICKKQTNKQTKKMNKIWEIKNLKLAKKNVFDEDDIGYCSSISDVSKDYFSSLTFSESYCDYSRESKSYF